MRNNIRKCKLIQEVLGKPGHLTVFDALFSLKTIIPITKSIKQVCVQLPTCADNVALPAFAAARRAAAAPAVQQSIDISYPPGLQQQTCRTLLQRANGTDSRTDTVPFHRPCSTYCAGSANNSKIATDLCFRTRYPQISVKIKPRLIKYLCKRYCAFSAFTLLVGRQEEHPACKN